MTNEMQMDTAPNMPAISNALICQHDLEYQFVGDKKRWKHLNFANYSV